MNDKSTKLMEMINETSKDEAVKNNHELLKILMNSYRDLENGKGTREVCLKLNSSISTYLMTNKYQAPRAIVELSSKIQKDANSFWKGTGIIEMFR